MCLIYICNSLFVNMVHQGDVFHFHQLLVNKVSVGHSFPKSLFLYVMEDSEDLFLVSVTGRVNNDVHHQHDLAWFRPYMVMAKVTL